MIRALNTGVLGMRQFQISMDVIGNNLANINTVAYKGARAEFQDTLSQTLKAPSPDTANTSGAIGMQVGSGMTVSSIKNQFTQGSMRNTGVRTDLAVNGPGFFLVKDTITNKLFATRAGDFREDKNGYLVTNDGLRVQGKNKMSPAYTLAEQTEIGDIKLDAGQYSLDRSGVSLDYSTNTFTKAEHGYSTGNQVKFSSVVPQVANELTSTDSVFYIAKNTGDTFTLHKSAADAATAANPVNFTGNTDTPLTGFTTDVLSNKLTLTGHGLVTGETVYLRDGSVPDGLEPGKSYVVRVSGDDLFFHRTADDATNEANTVDITTTGSADFNLFKDSGNVSALTLVGGASISQYNFGADGSNQMLLTDGTQYNRGQVLLQTFKNEQTLIKEGGNRFSNLAAAGPFGVAGNGAGVTEILANAQKPGEGGTGSLSPGSLELSNVDMADEFSRMITTQRAFQANARVISTADEILKEMMALKR